MYKTNHNIVYSCKYHIVWCPKYRRAVLIGDVEKRLKEIICQLAKEFDIEIIEMETDLNHIHILEVLRVFIQNFCLIYCRHINYVSIKMEIKFSLLKFIFEKIMKYKIYL